MDGRAYSRIPHRKSCPSATVFTNKSTRNIIAFKPSLLGEKPVHNLMTLGSVVWKLHTGEISTDFRQEIP